MNKENFSQKMIANSIYQKLEEYWLIMNVSSQISVALDLWTKLSVFSEFEKTNIKNLINNLLGYFSQSIIFSPIIENELVDIQNFFKKLYNLHTIIILLSCSSSNLINDLEKYLAYGLEDNIDLLL